MFDSPTDGFRQNIKNNKNIEILVYSYDYNKNKSWKLK